MAQKSREENRVDMIARRKGLRLMRSVHGTYFLKHRGKRFSNVAGAEDLPDLNAVLVFLIDYRPEQHRPTD